jgi:hypothetical protein
LGNGRANPNYQLGFKPQMFQLGFDPLNANVPLDGKIAGRETGRKKSPETDMQIPTMVGIRGEKAALGF